MRTPISTNRDTRKSTTRGVCFAILLLGCVWGAQVATAQDSIYANTNPDSSAQSPAFFQPEAAANNSNATDTQQLGNSDVESIANDVATEQRALEQAAADSVAASKQSTTWASQFMRTIGSAGPMMIPILGCSILLVMFALERAITLRKSRVIPKHFAKLFLNELQEGELKPVDALELCEENKSPISDVFSAAVKKWNRPSVEVEQAVIDEGERVANGLRRYLRLFNGIATISPLLGLLGTVLGMITAFNEIASSNAMGRPEQLANGIGQALLTTAGGLSVAIPAYIAYMYFSSRVDQLIMEIDSLGQKVVNLIASDAWKAKDTRGAKKAA